MTMLTLDSALTPGEIARRLNQPLHRITHILDTRKIQPLGRAGIVRIYDERAAEQVRVELAAIDAKRMGAGR